MDLKNIKFIFILKMKTEVNEKIPNKVNEYFLKVDFVKYINNLSDSIKEYYKLSKNTSINKTIIVNDIEKELNVPESISNIKFNINNEAYKNVQSYNEVSKKINENFKKLKENINLEEINLKKFFEDAKIIFKKMKDYRQEYIQNNLKKQKSSYGINTKKNNNICPDANNKINTTHNLNQNFENLKNKNYPLTIRNGNVVNNNTDNSNTITFNNVLDKSNEDSDSTQNESKNKDMIISSLKLQIKNIKQKFMKEIDALNKQILMIKKHLSGEQMKNQELKNENKMLKNKHELELSQLSKRNTELSKTLMNNQNELLNLQKEILDKTKELEILKKSSINSLDSKMLVESFITVWGKESSIKNSGNNRPWNNLSESLNRILENYKNENQKLKIDFHEKIEYYQEQLRKAKNELLEKVQINMENDIKREKEINEIKNDYNKKMEEVNNKNVIIDNYINLCQEANNNLMNRITQINQKVSAKEMKIIKLEEENQELQEKVKELYNLKDSNNLNDIDLRLKEENINLNKKLEEQNQTNEKLKEELKVISNEHDSYHRRLLSLGIKFIGEHESKITREEGFDILNDEIKQLKQQNETLKSMIETLIKDFLGKYKEKKEENEKYDDEKGKLKEQYDIIEELKQVTFKAINGQGNNTNEVNLLKKENEKLIEQILKLTDENAKIQKEHEALQKQYHKMKNEKKGVISNLNNTNNDEILNELKKVKKENEQIKKKNDELILKLEDKEIKHNYDNKSEDGNKSNYEEEFDLRKMAKGAKEKNRSQDNNIDYPGIQMYKEKYRDIDFKYNSLEDLVKNLLLNVQVGSKNKIYVNELCKLVGFDLETTNKILNNKNNKKVLGLFQK